MELHNLDSPEGERDFPMIGFGFDSLFNRATVTILRPAISLSLFVLSSLSSDILALKQESRIVRKFRDVSKVSTVFLSGSLALPLLLFSVQILA